MNQEIDFLLYSMPDTEGSVQVVVKDETVWCSQKAMAQLFGVGVPAISKHLKNIFDEGELTREVVISKMETTTPHGAIPDQVQIRSVDFYNLDAIISVGYRVSSVRATKFRQWATQVLREYIRKGFAMDDERLKQGTAFFLARITSGSCWSVSVPSAQVNAASGSKSPTSTLSAVLTTTKGLRQRRTSTL